MKKHKISSLASLLTAGAMLISPLKAEQLSGTIDDVYITNQENIQGELLEGVEVQVQDLGSDMTDNNGNYNIFNTSVIDPEYNLPDRLTDNNRLYDISGRKISDIDKNNIEARILPENVNLPSGRYFIQLESGLAIPFTKLDKSRTLPNILAEKQRLEESLKNGRNRTSAVRRLTASKDGYHVLSRDINIEDNTLYNPFMIPVEEREDTSWVYPTTLDGLSVYIGPISGTLYLVPRPSDLPFPIWIYENNIPEPNDSVNYLEIISSVCDDFNRNGNWYNPEFNILDGDFPQHEDRKYSDFPQDEIDRIGKGVIFNFVSGPFGGGLGFVRRIREYEDGTDYLFIVDISRGLGRFTPRALRGVASRELFRVSGGVDRSPQDSPYISAYEAVNVDRLHPQEEKIINLCWNINQRYPTNANRPNIRDWYLGR
jgi:hypothetical protein